MKRILLVAALLSGTAAFAPSASACTVETCPGTSVVCGTYATCHVCYIRPEGAVECIV